ncbi:MAG: YraN family protein [Dongiaceae bacterium]
MTYTDKRRDAEKRGRRAELMAAWFLRLKGYRVLARRYRTPAGEIDLIARRGRTLAFVEVKERPDETAALEAVTPTAQRRIARAAALWVSRHPAAAELDLRFDVVLARPGRLPRHLAAVFDSDGNVW